MAPNEQNIKKFYKEFDLQKHSQEGKKRSVKLNDIIKIIKGKKKVLDLA
jgi:hypothetical protein